MTQPNSDSTQNTFNISGSSVGNMLGSGVMNINEATQQRETENASTSSETVAKGQQKVILILAANPKSTPTLRLDEEVRERLTGTSSKCSSTLGIVTVKNLALIMDTNTGTYTFGDRCKVFIKMGTDILQGGKE